MSNPATAKTISEGPMDRPTTLSPTQPFAWSVRREIWEHRAIWIAPLVAAGLIFVGFLLRMFQLPHLIQMAMKLPPMAQEGSIAAPFAIAAGAIMITGFIVAVFFCLGTLNNERRDRSILFWKSLPVSDTTTVLSKAFIPFVVLPVVVFVVAIATQLIMLLIGSAILAMAGMDAGILWTHWPILRMTVFLAYLLVINVLWFAPIFGWLLMVSSWARRVAFLWAVLPWLGLALVEKIALDTSYVGNFIDYRFKGVIIEGFSPPAGMEHMGHHMGRHAMDMQQVIDPLSLMAPGHFLSTPGMWLGLLAAAAFIAAAIYFRRMREPG